MKVETPRITVHLNAKTGTVRLYSRKAPAWPLAAALRLLTKGEARLVRKALYRAGRVALAATRRPA